MAAARYFTDHDAQGNQYCIPLEDAEDWYTWKSFLGERFGPDTVPSYALLVVTS